MYKITLCFLGLLGSLYGCRSSSDTTPDGSDGSFIIESIKRNTASEKVVTVGDASYITGYAQVSSNNQDAYIIKQVNGNTIWARYYDKSPDDSRGEAIAANANSLVVAFTCTGGNTDFKATTGSFQTSYGAGGGPKIVFLARLNPQNGDIVAGSFIGARLSNNNTNTLRPEDNNPSPISLLSDNKVQFRATKAFDKGDGRLTPQIGNDADCQISGGKWVGTFDSQMKLLEGDCLP